LLCKPEALLASGTSVAGFGWQGIDAEIFRVSATMAKRSVVCGMRSGNRTIGDESNGHSSKCACTAAMPANVSRNRVAARQGA
jgi:hypothetical protein